MTDHPRVGTVRPIYETPRVANPRRVATDEIELTLIYISEPEFKTLQAQAVANPRVRAVQIIDAAKSGMNGNAWALAMQMIETMKTRRLVDIATNDDLADDELYPGRGVLVRGLIGSAKSVTPSGFDLLLREDRTRILVDRMQGLHLNQSFLAGKEAWVLARVVSIPRRQLRAAAVAIKAPQRRPSVGTIVGLSSESATD